MGERGKALLALIAKPKGKGDEGGMMADSEDEGEPGVSEGMRAAAEEIASLLGVPDEKVDALAQALKDFYDNC